MTQFEFYKSFQFVLELLLSTLIFTYRLKRRERFAWRLPLGILSIFVFAWVIPVASSINPFYVSFVFLLILIYMILVSKFIFQEKWMTLLFCCVAGYTTQHLFYELYSLAINALGMNVDSSMGFYGDEFTSLFTNPFHLVVYVSIFVMTLFTCFICFGDKLDPEESVELNIGFVFIFSIFILLIDIILNAVVVFYFSNMTLVLMVIEIYNILCCSVALYLQFEVSLKRRLEITLDTERQVWKMQAEQYHAIKENIDLINCKCHDLRHQIRTISSGSLSPTMIKEIENSIKIYDSVVKSGNDALDVILTEKSLLCNKNDVQLSCIVDGAKLQFMKNEDIYALFGNILDNAIEAVLKLEKEKRNVSLQVKSIGNMVTIRESNYYADIRMENGIPQTNKDRRYHGFGMRSIQHICNEYDGDLSVTAEDNIFTINILFIPETTQEDT